MTSNSGFCEQVRALGPAKKMFNKCWLLIAVLRHDVLGVYNVDIFILYLEETVAGGIAQLIQYPPSLCVLGLIPSTA